MFKKVILAFLLFTLILNNITYSADSDLTYTKLTTVDLHTFNEYRFRITEQYLELRNHYEIYGSINITVANNLLDLAATGYKYLPDNLLNKNLHSKLKTALNKGIQYPNNSSNYALISNELLGFLENANIEKITGSIEAFPETGNAPLTVTFRGNAIDPSGTKIPTYNYTWWMDEGGKRKILTNNKGASLNYTFREEGTFSVFLDVTSNHKNVNGHTDVLPFRSRADIKVKEKIASLIIKINSSSLRNKDELKFTPEEASYGLIFDATSSTPTGGSTFSRTEWDFGNGIERDNKGDPKIERVIYSSEGEYTVKLKLRTNEGKVVEREFLIIVYDPIATINLNKEEGFMDDKFTFSTKSGINDDDLTYAWEIIDISKDEVIFRKNGKLFTYFFKEKGQYNIVLKVMEPSSNKPDIDTKIIYINSRSPIVDFVSNTPFQNRPNTVLLDATKSYDPDFSDEGKLNFAWVIDGERVELENPNYNGSIGYYTFDSIGDHSVVLEVEDPDGIVVQKQEKVKIKSILSVDFAIFPRVAIREQTVSFIADSAEAKVFEWDFGDTIKSGGKNSSITHKYDKSGIFKVRLKVIDKDDNVNTFIRDVYIGESNRPYGFINLTTTGNSNISYQEGVCNGERAYIINRVDSIKLTGEESINIDGTNRGLNYSWKLGKDKYYTTSSFLKKFDELGCFPVKLVVTSEKNGKSDTKTIWVKVENIKPTLSSIDVTVQDDTTDPVIVNLSALGAKDLDGVIQSYLWYYYTDIDSEPQDFRATRSPNTNFVLPKVTGNYYFVVVMKDNNEARINSEVITNSKYFITLSGDNINTPIVDLSVNNSSISIGDKIVFTAKVQNVLGQDITKKVEFSWDLDGDGFYEKGNNTSIIEYDFVNSGEFHSKVKAKYKGFSNTKSITMNVSNVLKPEFSYISIGSKFIFLDKSVGENSKLEWDLGDGTIVKNKTYFIHKYLDNKTSHHVTLKIQEGSKSKEIRQKVIKNIKNYIKTKKGGLIVFTNPHIVDDEININKREQIYVYFETSTGDIKNYIVDNDLDYDSDLNGGEDDDEDNVLDDSYITGSPVLIKLNNSRTQRVRVFVKDSLGKIIEHYDFTINKLYIEEEIDMTTLDFVGVSDSEKLKIEKLKNFLGKLPKEHKLKALMYVQKLQEEWFDNREKTNVILEFEIFVNEIPEIDSLEIINVLESLLVEGQEDKSEQSIMFNALKNLIPLNIKCLGEEKAIELVLEEGQISDCYLSLVEKLEIIRDNINVEENKILGSEILKIIEIDKIMENKQKIDFKAILKNLVYGGLENIPIEDIQNSKEIKNETEGKDILGLIGTILFWIFMIILSFIGIVGLYYVYYLVINKNKNIGFQDFIIDKTSGRKKKISEEIKIKEKNVEDILGNLNKEKTSIEKEEKEKEIKEKGINKESKQKNPEVFNFTEVEKDKEHLKNIVNSEEKDDVLVQKETSKEIKFNEVEKKQKDIKKDDSVPEWLKGSFGTDEKNQIEKVEKKVKEKREEKLPTNEELEEITKINEEESTIDIPDWLKENVGIDEIKKDEIKEKKVKQEKKVIKLEKENKTQIKTKNKPVKKTNKSTKKSITKNKKEEKKITLIKDIKKIEEKKKPNKEQKKDLTKKVKNSSSDLWDDGMKIPDWLKTDDKK